MGINNNNKKHSINSLTITTIIQRGKDKMTQGRLQGIEKLLTSAPDLDVGAVYYNFEQMYAKKHAHEQLHKQPKYERLGYLAVKHQTWNKYARSLAYKLDKLNNER